MPSSIEFACETPPIQGRVLRTFKSSISFNESRSSTCARKQRENTTAANACAHCSDCRSMINRGTCQNNSQLSSVGLNRQAPALLSFLGRRFQPAITWFFKYADFTQNWEFWLSLRNVRTVCRCCGCWFFNFSYKNAASTQTPIS